MERSLSEMKFISSLAKAFLTMLLTIAVLVGLLVVVLFCLPATSEYMVDTLDMLGLPEGFTNLADTDPEDTLSIVLADDDADTSGGTTAETDPITAVSATFDTNYYPYYGMLDETAQTAYALIYAGYMAGDETVSLKGLDLTVDEFLAAWKAVYSDHPELFRATGKCTYTSDTNDIVLEAALEYYTFDEGAEAAEERFLEAAQTILTEAAKLSTDYEKELYIHDALAEMACYDADADYNQSAYSALVCGSSVCAGYARAFQYLMIESGIPCYYCTGSCGGDHAWNIVRLDAEYYNVDLTWDDASGSYAFFNRTDADLARTHTRTEMSVDLPVCDGETYRNTAAMPEEQTPDFSGGGQGGISGDPPDPSGGQSETPGGPGGPDPGGFHP